MEFASKKDRILSCLNLFFPKVLAPLIWDYARQMDHLEREVDLSRAEFTLNHMAVSKTHWAFLARKIAFCYRVAIHDATHGQFLSHLDVQVGDCTRNFRMDFHEHWLCFTCDRQLQVFDMEQNGYPCVDRLEYGSFLLETDAKVQCVCVHGPTLWILSAKSLVQVNWPTHAMVRRHAATTDPVLSYGMQADDHHLFLRNLYSIDRGETRVHIFDIQKAEWLQTVLVPTLGQMAIYWPMVFYLGYGMIQRWMHGEKDIVGFGAAKDSMWQKALALYQEKLYVLDRSSRNGQAVVRVFV